jgi:hypothetical protein
LVQVAIDPDEGLAGGDFGRWWEAGVGEAAVEVPGEEQPFSLGIDMGEAAVGIGHIE